MKMKIQIKKYVNKQVTYLTKGLQFYKNKKLLFLAGYSWSNDGNAWEDTKGNTYRFGYFKQVGVKTVAKSFVIGRLKFNYVIANKG
jgi:hypothetical protein